MMDARRLLVLLYLVTTSVAVVLLYRHYTWDDDRWDEAVGDYKTGQVSRARVVFIHYALNGDPLAAELLANIAALDEDGKGPRRGEALVWLLFQEDAASAAELACYYEFAFHKGKNVAPNPSESAFWYSVSQHFLPGSCGEP